MLSPDQITAIAPDAASLKAGRGLATARKWQTAGGDAEVLWGLAMGSGSQPYQTRVSLGDLASKCSCPSRKFPCKHALGLMFISVEDPAALTEKERPAWVAEWLESRSAREEKAAKRSEEKAAKPVDEKAAEKRRAQRAGRIGEGVALLRQALLDFTREGLASATVRSAATWEGLAKRMIDAQAPGLAGALRHIGDTVLRQPDVDVELPLELGRLYLLLESSGHENHDEATRAEIAAQLGDRATAEAGATIVEDTWFVAGRRVEERDRLVTSTTWLRGLESGRWARVLRFAPVPQTIAESWPFGSRVKTAMAFQAGLLPVRASADGEGMVTMGAVPEAGEEGLEAVLVRFAEGLSANPFLRAVAFFSELRPAGHMLVDRAGQALPWEAQDGLRLRVDCICAGGLARMCGEWDGRALRLLAIADGATWFNLTPALR